MTPSLEIKIAIMVVVPTSRLKTMFGFDELVVSVIVIWSNFAYSHNVLGIIAVYSFNQ